MALASQSNRVDTPERTVEPSSVRFLGDMRVNEDVNQQVDDNEMVNPMAQGSVVNLHNPVRRSVTVQPCLSFLPCQFAVSLREVCWRDRMSRTLDLRDTTPRKSWLSRFRAALIRT